MLQLAPQYGKEWYDAAFMSPCGHSPQFVYGTSDSIGKILKKYSGNDNDERITFSD